MFKRRYHDIINSFYNPHFYAGAHERSIKSALSNLILISFIVALFFGVVSGIAIEAFVRANVLEQVRTIFPQDLVITIKDGKASTNVEEPYMVPLNVPAGSNDAHMPKNLVVIDTKHPLTIQDVRNFDSLAVLSEDSVYFQQNSEIRVSDLSKIKEAKIDRPLVDTLINKIQPYLPFLGVIVAVLVVIAVTIGQTIAYLISALVGACVVLLIARIKGMTLTYRTAYIISLFAMIPLALFSIVASVFHVGSFLIWWLLFVTLIIVNLRTKDVGTSVT